MRLSELRSAARVWQESLGLHEWTLFVAWGKKPEDPDSPDPKKFELAVNCDGSAYWIPEHPNAVILIRRNCASPIHTLVHELLHIRLEGHRSVRAYSVLYERGLNALTAALLGEPEP